MIAKQVLLAAGCAMVSGMTVPAFAAKDVAGKADVDAASAAKAMQRGDSDKPSIRDPGVKKNTDKSATSQDYSKEKAYKYNQKQMQQSREK